MSSTTDNTNTNTNANATTSSTNNANTNTSQQRCPHGTNCRFQARVENPCPKSHTTIDQPCPYEARGRGTCSHNMRGPGYCLFIGGHRNSRHVVEGTVPMQFFTSASRAQQPRQSQYAAFEEKRLADAAAINRDIREKRAARAMDQVTITEPVLAAVTEKAKLTADLPSVSQTKLNVDFPSLSQTTASEEVKSARLIVVGEATWFHAKDGMWVDVSTIAHHTEKAISARVNNPTFTRLITSHTDPRITPEPVVQTRPTPTIVTINYAAGIVHYMKSKYERWYDVTRMVVHYSLGEYSKPVPQLIWTQLHNDISQGRIQAVLLQPF